MMYLSQLLIDTGGNPDRLRPGRSWLNNIYNVHRRLSMAFPMRQRKDGDPRFLQPFNPADFERHRFLFRVDNNIDGEETRAMVLVQSSILPDWNYAFQNATGFLAAPPQVKEYTPNFSPGQQLRFRILINASVKRKIEEMKDGDSGRVKTGKVLHKRVAFTWDADVSPSDALAEWFAKKASKLGFTPIKTELVKLGWIYGSKPEPRGERPRRENEYRPLKYRSALLEGYLKVDEPELFKKTLVTGIGSAKSMGFGLLSVIPTQDA
ncbi:MAG: type I-E CRISPR-associated protein Cas6/Cse3/CasE [Candidatus Syntrophosphaera sp.]|jgi:CRISPR system Cascade subunit CasE|nr:type I-E CRISPR-associated protein Cas6/Cse3/CasE [Candidatus Cloacimonadota bacterium]MDX9950334.1 type I-E CRISPR-associated protein Cas6/Cse3/CasE [Candidatus Syntrophosphaera sp.]